MADRDDSGSDASERGAASDAMVALALSRAAVRALLATPELAAAVRAQLRVEAIRLDARNSAESMMAAEALRRIVGDAG